MVVADALLPNTRQAPGHQLPPCRRCYDNSVAWMAARNTAITLQPSTHWGRVTHTCVSKQTIIGSDDDLPPGRRQAIIWSNAGILVTGPLYSHTDYDRVKVNQDCPKTSEVSKAYDVEHHKTTTKHKITQDVCLFLGIYSNMMSTLWSLGNVAVILKYTFQNHYTGYQLGHSPWNCSHVRNVIETH